MKLKSDPFVTYKAMSLRDVALHITKPLRSRRGLTRLQDEFVKHVGNSGKYFLRVPALHSMDLQLSATYFRAASCIRHPTHCKAAKHAADPALQYVLKDSRVPATVLWLR